MFMRVNSKCAHQARPPLSPILRSKGSRHLFPSKEGAKWVHRPEYEQPEVLALQQNLKWWRHEAAIGPLRGRGAHLARAR